MIKQSIKEHRPTRYLALILLTIMAFNATSLFAQVDGKKIFKANCASCHTITEQKLVGPGLKGSTERWTDRQKLYSWVKNSQEFLKTGDAYANKLYEQFNKSQMTAFPDLTNDQIDAIFGYVEAGDQKSPSNATSSSSKVGEEKASNGSNQGMYYLLIGLLIVLIILIALLGGVKKSLKKIVSDKKGEIEEPELGFREQLKNWIKRNKVLVIIIGLILVICGLNDIWNGLLKVGVYQGYAPEQPIKFSHKIHAGENKINCVYCHSGAEKSRTAGIPSANVCMNCHKGIQEGSITGKEEINKIYKALDYDPATGTYGNNPTPIRWVKVHNLPDLAYFNHSQHVVVGNVACQTCHGEVEKMDVIEQHAPLTMGWCVDCHRNSEVKMDGSEYYKEIHNRLSDELKAKFKKDGKITVDELGGLECAKCHY